MYIDIDDLSGFFAEKEFQVREAFNILNETSQFFQQQIGKNTINDPKFWTNAFLIVKNYDEPHMVRRAIGTVADFWIKGSEQYCLNDKMHMEGGGFLNVSFILRGQRISWPKWKKLRKDIKRY